MSHKIFVISDTHFGHANILSFKRTDGTPLRKFNSVEEMDETIIQNWNKVVRPQDKIYHLGDVAINKKALDVLYRLNGHKRLVRGNHDIYSLKSYTIHFEEILGVRVFSDKGVILSHIPIHPESLSRWKYNIHGHLHANKVMLSPHHPDTRYKCVSVENINYTPVELDSLIE